MISDTYKRGVKKGHQLRTQGNLQAKGHKGDQVESIFVTLAKSLKSQRSQSVNECVLRCRSESFKTPAKVTIAQEDTKKKWGCICN